MSVWPSGQQPVAPPLVSARSHGAGVQGSALRRGSSDPAILAAKGGDSCFPTHRPLFARSPEVLDFCIRQGSWQSTCPPLFSRHWWKGRSVPEDPRPRGAGAQGIPGQARSSATAGGEVPVAQMTAGLSLCLQARVKLDSREASHRGRG